LKAHNYRRVKGCPYTRTKYIHSSPPSKIVKFTMGDTSGDFEYNVFLKSRHLIQIRHNALEAARMAVNRYLEEHLGREGYFLQISLYPHVILRENKMIFGAHADRLQDGMRNSFGKPIGSAARVKVNQSIIVVKVNKNGIEDAKEALRRAGSKLPTTCRIVIEKIMD